MASTGITKNTQTKPAVHPGLSLQENYQALAIGNYFSLDKGLLMGVSGSMVIEKARC
jgi:hypothetical protein